MTTLLEVLPAMVPQSPDDIKRMLETYLTTRDELHAMGYYNVPADTGTRVQSNRAGRPTERTALDMSELSAHCRMVESWLRDISPLEMDVAQYYMTGALTVQQMADHREWRFHRMRAVVDALPDILWSRHFEQAT